MKKLSSTAAWSAFILLFATALFQSCTQSTEACKCPEQIIVEYFTAIAEENPDLYNAYIQNWDGMDENEKNMVMNGIKEFAKNISAGNGIKEVQISRITVPITFILNDGQELQHRQTLVLVDGKWMIRP